MEGDLRGPDRSRGEITEDAVAAARVIDGLGLEPLIVGYHPVARMNPFQQLLYQRSLEAGVAALPVVRAERIDELTELARLGIPTVIHLHWLNMIFGRAESTREGRRARDRFLARLDRHHAAGGRIVWTVHNILPHGAEDEAEEAALRRSVVERADVVHIMASRTVELVQPFFTIPPEKVFRVPHPSYAGAYEDIITREQARYELGLEQDDHVYLVIGAIKPYKGLATLLDAWDGLPAGPIRRRLVIAGEPGPEPEVPGIVERCARRESVVVHPRSIAAKEMQVFLRAADIAVLPYLRTLNSGALMLALTFGLPVVVPDEGALNDIVGPAFARTFSPDDPASLTEALLGASELRNLDARAAARAEADAHPPGPLSLAFATGIRERIGLVSASPASRPRRERASVR
jgi:glycosyltransferase involved in cell wall biosynthesis